MTLITYKIFIVSVIVFMLSTFLYTVHKLSLKRAPCTGNELTVVARNGAMCIKGVQ